MSTKILLIDDENDLLETTKEILQDELKVEIETCNNPTKAIDLIRSFKPNLIISDFMMPKINGIELLQKLRAEGNFTSVIFLTAHSQKELILKSLKLGAVDYIEKPFKREMLVSIVTKQIEIIKREKDLSTTPDDTKKAKMLGLLKVDKSKVA